jgi:hemolysin activation/secretion protein
MSRFGVVLALLACVAPLAGLAADEARIAQAVAAEAERFPIRGFAVEGNHSVPTDRILGALGRWIGDQQTAEALLHARDAVVAVYRDAGYEMVSVELPSRIGLDGIVRLRVRETTLGRITVSGNQHFAAAHFRAILPSLQEDRSPNLGALARELFLANDHPAYRVTLAFTPGAPERADVEIKVTDASAVHAVLSVDNSGTASTGRGRATATLSHANLWGRGHEGLLAYTTSPQFPSRVQQLVLSYQAPLAPLGSRLQVGASYSNADVGRVAEVFDVAGQGSTLSLRLQRDLLRSDSARQLAEVGIEDKRNRNTVDFFGANLGVDVNARPVSLNYVVSAREGFGSIAASLGYTRNLPGGARNDDATYQASRAGASARWSVWRAKLELESAIAARWTWTGRLEAQYTHQPLVSAEQFGLGGARSVRGFEERETSGDRGWRLSSEVLSPPLAVQHRLLAFVDAGAHDRLQRLPGEPGGTSLASYGVGWRWAMGASLAASLDIARVLRGTTVTPAGSHGLHFSASWRPF